MNVVIIIVLMLCVSGFSIVTGLIILILDSVQLIGTLKALGANNQFVRKVFIYQAILLISKGLLWGNAIGLVLCALQYFTHIIPLDAASYYVSYVPMAFPWVGWLLLNVGTLLVSWVILLAPSAIITQISPAKVMHFE
jgi:lipoprotein-releasing system permease protein